MKASKFACSLVILLFAGTCLAQTITTFDPPTSTSTVPQAINIFGQVTGFYTGDQDPVTFGVIHSFIRQPDGTITSFDVSAPGRTSRAMDINELGQITGTFDTPFTSGGFLRETDGTIVIFSGAANIVPPGAPTLQAEPVPCTPYERCIDGTGPIAINLLGQITGVHGNEFYAGFLRQSDGTTIEFRVSPGRATVPQAINLLGQITGHYQDSSTGLNRGFLRQRNGTIVTFDAPNATETTPVSVNLTGQITGYYRDASSVNHAFLRRPNGTFITFDPPGSVGTEPKAINLEGRIAGYYATADGVYHGFLRAPNGRIDTFDVPNALGTFPKDINDLGQIVGYYQDSNFVLHGFVRSAQ